jgi:predicted permease
MSRRSSPSVLPVRLLTRLLGNGRFADSVAGDLTEELAARVARRARFKTLWCWGQCASIALRMTIARCVGVPLAPVLTNGPRDATSAARAIRGDLSRGLRNAMRQPMLVALCALAIALGVASPTTIFSIVHGLSRDLPFEDGDRIVYVTQSNRATGERDIGLTEPVLTALSRAQHSLEGIAAFSEGSVSLVDGNVAAERYSAARISPTAFSLLRVRPAVGTMFTEDDAGAGVDVAIISDGLWHLRFGGAPDVVGRTVRLNGRATRIAGVMPADFRFPFKDDVWLPLALRPASAASPVSAFGRLRPGVTAGAADAEFARIGARVLRDPSVPDLPVVTRVLPFKESQLEASDFLLFRAMVLVVSTVLLVACANVANLLLAHVAARGPLFAVKVALGASRGAIIREMLAESGFMAVLGGAGGLVLADGAVRWFNASVAEALPFFWMKISIDAGVLAFSTVLIAVATIAAGLVPALYASRTDPAAALRGHGAGASSRGSARAMRALLTVEIALSCALLAIAGMMTKGALRGSHTALRVDPTNIVSAQVDLGFMDGDSTRANFAAQATARATIDPRLTSLAFTTVLPGIAGVPTKVAIGGQVYSRNADFPRTRLAIVSPRYFQVLGVHAARGRLLEESDVRARTHVAVVNDAFVRAHLASQPAIGARVQLHDGGDTAWVTIVGTVPDLITVSKDQSTVELIMVPLAQRPPRSMSMLATGPGQTALVTDAVRDLVREIDRDVPVTRVQRLTDEIARSRRASWSLAYVFAECGLAGLVLTALGLYGVADTTSRRRVRELAIRRALGSSAHRVVGLIIGDSAVPLAIGLAVGCGAALLVGPSLGGLLFGVSPHDPMVFGLVVVTLAAVMLFAVVRPALWAAHASLTDTLRR